MDLQIVNFLVNYTSAHKSARYNNAENFCSANQIGLKLNLQTSDKKNW